MVQKEAGNRFIAIPIRNQVAAGRPSGWVRRSSWGAEHWCRYSALSNFGMGSRRVMGWIVAKFLKNRRDGRGVLHHLAEFESGRHPGNDPGRRRESRRTNHHRHFAGSSILARGSNN